MAVLFVVDEQQHLNLTRRQVSGVEGEPQRSLRFGGHFQNGRRHGHKARGVGVQVE